MWLEGPSGVKFIHICLVLAETNKGEAVGLPGFATGIRRGGVSVQSAGLFSSEPLTVLRSEAVGSEIGRTEY